MFENGFVYGTPLVAAAEKKNFLELPSLRNIYTEEFIKVKDL